MRRSDREVKKISDIVNIMNECDVLRIALNDGEYPYILPLNFGMDIINNDIVLYFHGADKGKKHKVIDSNNKASFEMDCAHKIVTTLKTKSCTMEYKSVIGQGEIKKINDQDEKYNALCKIMAHYHKEKFEFNKDVIPRTTVYKLIVKELTGKIRMKKND